MKAHVRAQLEKKFSPEQITELERDLTPEEIEKMVLPKPTKGGVIFFLVIILGLGYWMFSGSDEPEIVLTKTELHKKNIEKAFDPWSGAHKTTEKMIIKALNDPESYEHIQTTYRDLGEVLVISTEFTAKNGFGGTLRKTVIVKADTLGSVVEVIQWMND